MKGAKNILIFILIILLMLTGISTAWSPDSAGIPIEKGLNNSNAILLKKAQFDTSIPQPAVAASADMLSIPQYQGDVDGYYIVQFASYIREEWKQAVSDTGAVIFDYVPNNAFVVRMDPAEKSRVESLDEVQWIGIYQPSYRISPALSSVISTAAGKSIVTQEGSAGGEVVYEDIIILLFDANDNERVLSGIENLSGEIVDNAGDIIRARVDVSKIPDIAIINGVSWIEKYVQPVILNDVAANITNVYDVRNTYGLTGSGQIVAVADTGLDTGVDDNSMHDDIEGRIVALHTWWDTGAEDNSGHGTHVAGSVLGSGSRSNGQYAGMALEARLVFQAMQYDGPYTLYNGKLLMPINLSLLFHEAYDDDAKIHSNSWGSDNETEFGCYTSQSQYVDDFMWNNPDMLIIFAAGNEWVTGTITPPGTAKNALTVGASENDRPSKGSVSDNISEIASFSSKGPTDDNRIKPDIVAPGTYIISTRSTMTNASYSGGFNDYYAYSSGTSMATPLTAGTAALVRQYYVENESILPSAALLKATLINGATNLSLPSSAQGWGRVDLEQSLFPASPRTMRYHDDITLNVSESWNVSYCINNSSETLKITLVWTDAPAATFADPTLVNNLDLIVTGPSGKYYGNGAPESVNNVEQVELSSPPVGLYTIKVSGTNIPDGPQPFALVISGALDVTPFVITSATANPATIKANGSENTTFNVTAMGSGGIASVTMNLTAIGGSPIQALDNNSEIWQYTTNTTALGIFHLPVNVTDNMGHSNTSVTITLNTTDTTPPTSNTPSDTEFSANITANFDKWILTDLHPGYYWVLRNNTPIVPPTAWDNSTNITVSINTNISLGDFNYTIQYNDTAGNNGTQDTVIITINDTTKPILSDNMPFPGTNVTTPTMTISINATDRGSGINTNSAEMKVEGEQVLLSNKSSGFTFYFENTTTAAYNHSDTVNVTFNVSDNEGLTNSTSWMFYIDTAAPTITITSPADGYSTTASSVTVTGTVNGTGSPPIVTVNDVTAKNTTNSTVFNGTFNATASLIEGLNPIFANVTDAAGNTSSTLINITRTTVDKNNNGGGGGGGGGTSGEDFYNIAETQTQRVSIFKDENVIYSFEKTLNPVININFTAKVSAGKVASKIEVLQNTSTLVARPAPGKVYKNINIWVGNYGWASEKNIKDMTISFIVPFDWITSNNIDKGSIALYRYNDDSWERLPTSWTSKNENCITFTSSTQGFSPFAISGELASIPAVISTDNRTHVAVATNDSNITSIFQTDEIEPEPGNKKGTIMLWVLLMIIILAVTVIIFRNKDEILQGINNMRQQRGR